MPVSRKKEWLLLQKQSNISADKIFNILVKSGKISFPLFLCHLITLKAAYDSEKGFLAGLLNCWKCACLHAALPKYTSMAG